jgi:O-antigen ligase
MPLDNNYRSTLINSLIILCFLVIPFGPAAQNIALGLLILASLASLKKARTSGPKLVLPRALRWPLILGFLWVILHPIATALNPQNTKHHYVSYMAGFVSMFALPWLMFHTSFAAGKIKNWLNQLYPPLMICWFLVALSQGVFAWSLMRGFGDPIDHRASGFYSHPLTLAYCALLCWPISLYFSQRYLSRKTKKAYIFHLASLANLGILLLTNSRTCIAVAAFIGLWHIMTVLKGKQKLFALAAMTLISIGIGFTDNPISRKAAYTFAEDSPDIFSDYPDDRFAFWAAHALMIKERPIIGHGFGLDKPYRIPYYEAIGLGDFIRQYPAHNLFIQVTANTGIIGLVLYLLCRILPSCRLGK